MILFTNICKYVKISNLFLNSESLFKNSVIYKDEWFQYHVCLCPFSPPLIKTPQLMTLFFSIKDTWITSIIDQNDKEERKIWKCLSICNDGFIYIYKERSAMLGLPCSMKIESNVGGGKRVKKTKLQQGRKKQCKYHNHETLLEQ